MTDITTIAIGLLTTLDRIRSEVNAAASALEPYAEIHPYLAARLLRLQELVDPAVQP